MGDSPAPHTSLSPADLSRLAIDQTTQMVVVSDLEGTIQWMNSAGVALTEMSLDAAVGRPAREIIPIADGAGVQDDLDHALSEGRGFSGEIPYVIAGHVRWFHVELCPLRHAGTHVGFVGFNRDITETVERTSEREQGQRLKAIGSLAAGVAHEINTPVQYLSDNVHFLRESFDELLRLVHTISSSLATDENQEELLREIERSDLDFLATEIPSAIEQSTEGLQRVGRIVQGMRDFSRSGTGHFETDLNAAVVSSVEVTRGEWSAVAEVVLELDDALEPVVCNEAEVKHALLNLLYNAVAAIREGEHDTGSITVRTRRLDEHAVIEISDTGIGMTEENLGRAFDPFFSTRDEGSGTGQGLPVARSIIADRHSGSITLDSMHGSGTTARILLPLKED